jgi:hypothetical protein
MLGSILSLDGDALYFGGTLEAVHLATFIACTAFFLYIDGKPEFDKYRIRCEKNFVVCVLCLCLLGLCFVLSVWLFASARLFVWPSPSLVAHKGQAQGESEC